MYFCRRIKLLLISYSICISIAIARNASYQASKHTSKLDATAVPLEKKRPTAPRERVKKRGPGRGLTWDPCDQDSDCLSPRTCRKLLPNGNSLPCSSRSDCLCDVTVDLASSCIYDSQCHRGEFCFLPFKLAAGNCFSRKADRFQNLHPHRRPRDKRNQTKVSKQEKSAVTEKGAAEYTAAPTPESTPTSLSSGYGSGIKSEADNSTIEESTLQGGKFCIGINSLTDLSRKELKFERDIKARVLCDRFESCATGGHIVMVNGEGMMMSSYCKQTKCYERIMLVNSPKEAKYVRVKSKTDGLLFTGYSARYGTKVEEKVFRLITRVGL